MSVLASGMIVFANTVLSVAGSLALKHASQSGDACFAIVGCLAWAGTALGVFALLNRAHDLGSIALVSQGLGLIALLALSCLFYGEPFPLRRAVAVGLLLVSLALAA